MSLALSRHDSICSFCPVHCSPIQAVHRPTAVLWPVELTRRLDLDVSIYWDRTTFPKPDADGSIPKEDDFRLVVKLGVDF